MRLRKEPAIQVKSPEQIDRMHAAGQVVARTLTVLKEAVRPGISTAELDSIAEREIRLPGPSPRSWVTSAIQRRSARPSMSRSCTASRAVTRCCGQAT